MTKHSDKITLNIAGAPASAKIYNNIDDEQIIINVSKARNIYLKFIASQFGKDPYANLGTAATCIVAACTGEFHDAFGVPGTGLLLQAVFTVGAIYFTPKTLFLFYYRYKHKELSEDGFIDALKNTKN